MKYRGEKRKCIIQVIWTIVALVATIGLILAYQIGTTKDSKDQDQEVVNGAPMPTSTAEAVLTPTISPTEVRVTQEVTPTVAPTLTPTIAPTSIPTVTPTIAPTKIPISTPTVEPQSDHKEDQKMIAFTFDDGPYPKVTNRILKVLEDNDSHATFFVMGNRMNEYGDTVKKAVEAGNQIGNHTFSHKDLTKLKPDQIRDEVGHANKLINEQVKVGDAFLRPPYGAKNDTVKNTVKVPLIFWSVDSLDWKTRNADSVYEEVMKNVKDGDIILMHDLYPTTADAVERLIPELIAQGYQLVTVQQLLESKGIEIKPGQVYYNARQ